VALGLGFLSSGSVKAAEPQNVATRQGQEDAFYQRVLDILRQSSVSEPEGRDIPDFVDRHTPIFGQPEVTKEQMVRYILRHNPTPKVNVPLEQLVEDYYEEATAEGVRPDAALAQAILETGFFRYGGDVLPEQNNFAGLGTLGNGERGAWFDTARTGVRAHIQHILAYATENPPATPITDPRYTIVKQMISRFGLCQTWESLSGKWAVPGTNYGQRIVRIVDNVKNNR